MEGAEEELERRSKFLSSLIQKKKATEQHHHHDQLNIRVRASDMPLPLQNKAFRCARDHLDNMRATGVKLDSKRLALTLKKLKGTGFCFFGSQNFVQTLKKCTHIRTPENLCRR